MTSTADEALVDQMADFYADPLGFVMCAYPWGEQGGPLERQTGPFPWQVKFLTELGEAIRSRKFNGVDPVKAIRMARSSGHGIGKSTLVAWLVDWAMSTRKNCRISVTANTVNQLETKTWAAIQYWTKMCITSHWFEVTARRIRHKNFPESWLAVALTCDKDNSEAFAGQHSANSSSIYIFDEASAVPDEIWEVADGGLVKGEPMFFAFGNPTRNSGRFFRVNFGSEQRRWNYGSIDAREAGSAVSEEIQSWLEDYGEDSDYFRVRVRGLPPRASDLQYIGVDLVQQARQRMHVAMADEPLVAGYDAANGGLAMHVIAFRRGLDAKNVPPPIRLPGDTPRDVVVGRIAEIMAQRDPKGRVAALFGDQAFGAVILSRVQQLGYTNVFEVNFGGEAPDKRHCGNMRAFMWHSMKEWLHLGAIPDEDALELDLTGPGFHIRPNGQLILESKQDMAKRGVKSPDWGDALALTFARKVSPAAAKPAYTGPRPVVGARWG